MRLVKSSAALVVCAALLVGCGQSEQTKGISESPGVKKEPGGDPAVAHGNRDKTGAGRWEYKIVHFSRFVRAYGGTPVKEAEDSLNSLGQEGWEVCGTAFEGEANSIIYFTLKRPAKAK